jgi:oligoendopeptidase F
LFYYLKKDQNSGDKKAIAEISRIGEIYTKVQNMVVFFELTLAQISKDIQKQILKNKSLAHFHYFLECIWKTARYNLSEGEEKILSLMHEPAHGMWKRGVDKVLSDKKVKLGNKEVPVQEALGKLFDLPTAQRKELAKRIRQTWIDVAPFAESEINAIYTKKKIEDELRGFKNPYDSTYLSYQHDEKTVLNLVHTVTKNFKIAHEFYKIKADLLKEGTLDYSARGVSIGKIQKKFTFDEGYALLHSAFSKVDSKYSEMFEEFVTNGKIDLYPKVGKAGGAYCCGDIGVPTFVLHNYTDSYRAVNTLAHEMGHAFHTELSKSQSPLYEGYTISVAEVASTLFENFAFEEVFDTLSEDEKIIALHDKINGSIATVFRQVACFNFEHALHLLVREK